MLKRIFIILLIVSLAAVTVIQAGDFKDDISSLAKDNAKGYVGPLLTGFGTAANSGLYKKASVSPGKLIPVGFDIGIVTSFAIVPDKGKSFKYTLPSSTIPFDLSQANSALPTVEMGYGDVYDTEAASDETATIASNKDGTTISRKTDDQIINELIGKLSDQGVSNPDQYRTALENYFSGQNSFATKIPDFKFPDGLNAAAIPTTALQANLRLPFIGLEITGRGFPEYNIPDVGKLTFYGGGLRKSIPVPIVDVTVGGFYQKLAVGDFFDVQNMNYHLEVGKSIGLPFLFKFSPYAGVGMDQTKATLEYTLMADQVPGMDEDMPMKFDFEGDNKFRMTAGLTAQIIPLTYLNLEVAKGEYLSGTVSIGLIFK
ncbi:MAG: hypothetical protein K9N00_05410 [Candidatus Marinimicrobia bacterium]|nr:hypothetical protein [Candidatus Neomarinimicrobiota bacterium]